MKLCFSSLADSGLDKVTVHQFFQDNLVVSGKEISKNPQGFFVNLFFELKLIVFFFGSVVWASIAKNCFEV